MNVNPSPPQMLDNATAGSAVFGSCSRPGSLTVGKIELNQSMLASAPTDGCSRKSHIRLARKKHKE